MFKYFSRSAVAAAALAVSLGAQAGILIDDFSAPSTGEQAATDIKFKGVGDSVGSSAAGQSGSMIGGNRDIFVIETAVADPTRGDGGSSGGHINVADGVRGFSTDAGQYPKFVSYRGRIIILYCKYNATANYNNCCTGHWSRHKCNFFGSIIIGVISCVCLQHVIYIDYGSVCTCIRVDGSDVIYRC